MAHSDRDIIGRETGRQKKKPKGTVKVESDKGWLRLRFTYEGKRRAFALGLPDTDINRKFAEQKARQIELDIISSNFDSSLQKYKPQKNNEDAKTNLITAEELILKFIEYKSKFVSSPRSLEKYQTILTHLKSFDFNGKTVTDSLSNRPAIDLQQDCSEQFYQYLLGKLAPITFKQSIVWLSACWQWGINQEIVELDPWKSLIKRIKVPPKQMPKPFTVAQLTGHDVQTLYENYAGNVNSRPMLPEILE